MVKPCLLLQLNVAVWLLGGAWAQAQDCDGILRHGIRNVEITQSSAASVAAKWERNCGSESHWSSEDQVARAEVEIFGSGKGNGGFSIDRRKQDLRDWCNAKSELAQSASDEYHKSEWLMSDAVAAWGQCQALTAQGMHTNPAISGDQRTVALQVNYTGPGTAEFYGVEAENFTCRIDLPSGSIAKEKTPIRVTSSAISVHCKRADPVAKEVGGQNYAWTGRATIAVRTSAGQPYLLYFPESTDPVLPEKLAATFDRRLSAMERFLPPVGAVVAFWLRPDEVKALAPRWVPADGSVLRDAESRLDGRRLPDLVGRFAIGLPSEKDATEFEPNIGGSRKLDPALVINANTDDMQIHSCTGFEDEVWLKFQGQNVAVWDTPGPEKGCQHYHKLSTSITGEIPLPPYRSLAYLVRVR